MPLGFNTRHSLIKEYQEYKLENIEQGKLNIPITVTQLHSTPVDIWYPESHTKPHLIITNQLEYIIDNDSDDDTLWEAVMSAINIAAGAKAGKKRDLTFNKIGDPSNLNNYLLDSGITQHMNPQLGHLLEGQNWAMEVADGHMATTGKIKNKCAGWQWQRRQSNIDRCNVHTWVKQTALICHQVCKTCHDQTNFYFHQKSIYQLKMLQNKLGQRNCHTLLAAIEHDLWADENFRMTPEVGCLSGGIATIWATACDKEPHTTATRPGEHLFLDILYPIVNSGIKNIQVMQTI